MDLHLAGRRALVTGASRGLGRAIAQQLAEEGCNLAICARGIEALDEFAAELRDTYGVKVATAAVDAADPTQVQAFVATSAEELGGLDIVVANTSAGNAKGPDSWMTSFQGDLLAFVRLVEAARPHLESSDAGSIVAIGTTNTIDTQVPTGPNSYSALKTAVVHHAAALARQLAPIGIRVNTVSPGPTEFPGGAWENIREGRPELYESIRSRIPLGRLGRPEDVARAVTFVASPAAAFCTGTHLVVDGGFVSRVQV